MLIIVAMTFIQGMKWEVGKANLVLLEEAESLALFELASLPVRAPLY